MDLALAHKIIVAADEQPYPFLKIRDRELVHEVEEMATAGLVKAAGPDEGREVVIMEITDAGHKFVRAFSGAFQLRASMS